MRNYKEVFTMLNFIMMTISLTVSILLAGVIGLVIFLQPKVMRFYTKMVMKSSMKLVDDIVKITEDINKEDE